MENTRILVLTNDILSKSLIWYIKEELNKDISVIYNPTEYKGGEVDYLLVTSYSGKVNEEEFEYFHNAIHKSNPDAICAVYSLNDELESIAKDHKMHFIKGDDFKGVESWLHQIK